jgi:DNA repair photolyase
MITQLDLFDTNTPAKPLLIPEQIGKAKVGVLEKSQILTPASGFMGDYDFTISPYIGCQFGCAYCYAAFFVNSKERRESWDEWVDVKVNAINELMLRRHLDECLPS